jgi:hypothetical protein
MTYNVFSLTVVQAAWKRAGGNCECQRATCGHGFRCGKSLRWELRGSEAVGGWEAHHIDRYGPGTLSNCEILCQYCHKNTTSFGS